MLKAVSILTISILANYFTLVHSCHDQQNMKDQPVVENPQNNSSDLKVVAEGSHSAIEEPFIAVIREADTYGHLRQVEPQLPKLEADFFDLNVVVAAFLGMRNTGGYQVQIVREGGKIRVAEKTPPKGAMTSQVLTSPFKVVSIQPSSSTEIDLVANEAFRRGRTVYMVKAGNFSVSGGFAGQTESFVLKGQLELTRFGDLITVGFDLMSSGTPARSLRTFATGYVKKDEVLIDRVSHGSLTGPPSGELTVYGKFIDKDKLSLTLKSKPINVPESYGGSGTIEAEIVSEARP